MPELLNQGVETMMLSVFCGQKYSYNYETETGLLTENTISIYL